MFDRVLNMYLYSDTLFGKIGGANRINLAAI